LLIDHKASLIFLSIVLFSEQYLTVKSPSHPSFNNSSQHPLISRFFNICEKLPQELQMAISLRAVGLRTDFIKLQILENSLKEIFFVE